MKTIHRGDVDDRDFKSFYQEQLNKLKDKAEIQDFSDIGNNKFAVKLLSGSRIEIIHNIKDSNLIIIKYEKLS